jgi:Cu/Ag efflux pump CusA
MVLLLSAWYPLSRLGSEFMPDLYEGDLSFWLIHLLGYNLSVAVAVAVAVGFIALAGVAAEFGVVMLVYLDKPLA